MDSNLPLSVYPPVVKPAHVGVIRGRSDHSEADWAKVDIQRSDDSVGDRIASQAYLRPEAHGEMIKDETGGQDAKVKRWIVMVNVGNTGSVLVTKHSFKRDKKHPLTEP
jgi:hypothetical protein